MTYERIDERKVNKIPSNSNSSKPQFLSKSTLNIRKEQSDYEGGNASGYHEWIFCIFVV